MEPVSFLGFIVVSLAAGAMLSLVLQKPRSSRGKTPPGDSCPETQGPAAGIIDAQKEKAIDELIAKRNQRDH